MHSLGLLSALLVGANAFHTRVGPISAVPPADRLNDKQLFAREVEIHNWGHSAPYLELSVEVPARMFISVAKNPPNTVGELGKIKVSGSTEGAVDYISFPDTALDDTNSIQLYKKSVDFNASETDWLLVEIELYQKNFLKNLATLGSGDVIVQEDVLYAPEKLPADDTSKHGTDIMLINNGRIFVVDPKAEFTTERFDISSDPNGTIQIELAALNATTEELFIGPDGLANITLFVDRLSSLDVRYSDDAGLAARKVCVAAKIDVNVTERIHDDSNTTSRIVPRGSSCVKLSIPVQLPALIGGGIGVREVEMKTNAPSASSGASRWLPTVLVGCLGMTAPLFM